MNILLFDIGSYFQPDWVLVLERMGHHCRNVYYSFREQDVYHNEAFEALFEREWKEGDYDVVLSSNFFPVIGKCCTAHNVRYVAWCCDSPLNLETYDGYDHPANAVFFFDREQYLEHKRAGIDNVYHLPLAVNCDRLASVQKDPALSCDVSMLGVLYASTLPVLTSKMTDYDRGYIDAIVKAQSDLYGAWLVDDMLTRELIDRINAYYKELSDKAMQITDKQLSYSIATHITHRDRLSLLKLLSARHDVMLCTDKEKMSETELRLLPQVRIHGRLDYIREMPRLFKTSKINLNATLRCIHSGIPLRALDIMGCRGFLLSNYQPELQEYLVPGEECVLYESIPDAVEKAAYYLAHDGERERIARAGLARMQQDFRYEDRIAVMFETAGVEG